jgi:hypothetical protein
MQGLKKMVLFFERLIKQETLVKITGDMTLDLVLETR